MLSAGQRFSLLDSVFIFTHDSIFLGEDGPTHQPIEHLMSLRLIPNLDLIRPSNGDEVSFAYRYAFTSKQKPTVIVLTRQNLEPVNISINQEKFNEGAYVVLEGSDACIFASGNESVFHGNLTSEHPPINNKTIK